MNKLTGFLLTGYLLTGLCLLSFAPGYAESNDGKAEKPPFSDGDATAEGIDESALQNLVKRAGETHSSALVILKNGKLIGQWYFGHTIRAQALNSITKSICSLAIGKLIDEHKVASLDTPVASFYPQWRSGPRSVVTIREVLSHTTGLEDKAGADAGDVVGDALSAELKDKPGSKFVYNNRASNLLVGIVKMATGKGLDDCVNEKFFLPMAISDWHWNQDQVGAAPAMGGLSLTALDLAKFGQLVVDGGIWAKTQLVSKNWLVQSTSKPATAKVSADYALMWWLLPPPVVPSAGACMARGFHGQFMIVLPTKKLVVVRQISEKAHKSEIDDFSELPELVSRLVN